MHDQPGSAGPTTPQDSSTDDKLINGWTTYVSPHLVSAHLKPLQSLQKTFEAVEQKKSTRISNMLQCMDHTSYLVDCVPRQFPEQYTSMREILFAQVPA